MPPLYSRITLRYILQTLLLCSVLAITFGLIYAEIHKETESAAVRWGFGFLSVLTIGVSLSLHAHYVLIRPLHKLRSTLKELDTMALAPQELVVYKASDLECEFAEIESLFHEVLNKLQYRHREVTLTKGKLNNHKFIAMGEMAAGIAHEINNPLAILVGRSEQLRATMEKDGLLTPRYESILGSLEKTLFRIQDAVLDLESLASIPTSEDTVRVIHLSRLMKRMSKVVSNRAQTQEITFDCELALDLEIEGREVDLSQALLFLLEAATDAAASAPEKSVILRLRQDASGGCEIIIASSGVIAPESLGMNLAKSVVASLDGNIGWETNHADTTVRIRLPLKQANAA